MDVKAASAGAWANCARIGIALAVLLVTQSCNGLLVVDRGPASGDLNWAGRAFCRVGLFTDRLGLSEPVMDNPVSARELSNGQ